MKSKSNPAGRWRSYFFRLGVGVVFGCGLARAGEYSVTSWGVDEGLPQSSVTDIAQTPDGFIWISTLMSGLSRFDGVQFVNFDSVNTPALVNTGVRRLLVDKLGNLWVNDSWGNLLLRQGNSFIKVGEGMKLGSLVGEGPGRLAFTTIEGELVTGQRDAAGQWNWQHHKPPVSTGNTYYYEDTDGKLWFIAPGNKLGCYVAGQYEILDAPPGLAGSKIQALARDYAGRIWVGTDMELAYWDHGVFINSHSAGATAKISVRRITPVPAGLWVEADNRLYFYDQHQWHPPVADWNSKQAPWSHLRVLRVDNLGGLWISLGDEGLAHVDCAGKLVRVTSADGLPSQLVQAFFCDREGNLWAGYHRGGLIQVRKETFHTVARTEGLLDTLVTSVTEDPSGAVWMGTAGGSVARWQDGECQNFTLPLRGVFCQDVVVWAGPDGRVWIGTGGNGLLVWDKGEFQHALPPEQIPAGVRQLLVTKNGEVWFANFSGLYRFDGKRTEQVLAMTQNAQCVAALAEAPDGAILFGTMGGTLRRWHAGKLTSFQPLDALAGNRIWALWPEADGTVWAGTLNSGLLRFKDGQFTRFTKADGLADNYVSHILEDDLGNLWLGSSVGVMCVPKKSLESKTRPGARIPCRLFGRNDGLPTVAMTLEFQPSCVRARDGALWFGTPKGASWVRADDMRPPESAPPVLVESVWADRNPEAFAPAGARDKMPQLIVEPGVNNLEVRYTAPDFTAPQLMRFKYRLAPLDTDWQDAGSHRSVNYNHLPAGDYTFSVTAGNSDGEWNPAGAGFRLRVLPHFWERKSFLAAALLSLIALVAFIARRITQQRMRRKLELLHQQQQVERERARIARDLHDDLGAGLTEIGLTSDLAQNDSLPDYESREYVREIGTRARELVQRMDEIVWAVNPRNDSLNSLSVYACQYAQRLLKPLGLACRFDVQPGLPETVLNSEQRYNFFLAFKEAINNIARHSGATELHVAIHAEAGKLFFLVEDNGRGFELGGELAGADGLRNIRERLERLGGQCDIRSQPGQGTHIALCVPLTGPVKNGAQ